MCASWLHHGDHSLALLSWFTATQKKNLNLGCLPPFTLVCALLAAPYRNAALHHCESWMVLPSGVRLLAACVTVFGLVLGRPSVRSERNFPLVRPVWRRPHFVGLTTYTRVMKGTRFVWFTLGVGHCVWWCLDRLEAIGQPAGDFTPLFPLLRPSAGVRRLVAPFLTRVLA